MRFFPRHPVLPGQGRLPEIRVGHILTGETISLIGDTQFVSVEGERGTGKSTTLGTLYRETRRTHGDGAFVVVDTDGTLASLVRSTCPPGELVRLSARRVLASLLTWGDHDDVSAALVAAFATPRQSAWAARAQSLWLKRCVTSARQNGHAPSFAELSRRTRLESTRSREKVPFWSHQWDDDALSDVLRTGVRDRMRFADELSQMHAERADSLAALSAKLSDLPDLIPSLDTSEPCKRCDRGLASLAPALQAGATVILELSDLASTASSLATVVAIRALVSALTDPSVPSGMRGRLGGVLIDNANPAMRQELDSLRRLNLRRCTIGVSHSGRDPGELDHLFRTRVLHRGIPHNPPVMLGAECLETLSYLETGDAYLVDWNQVAARRIRVGVSETDGGDGCAAVRALVRHDRSPFAAYGYRLPRRAGASVPRP
jgi:hypothetical protein